MRIFMKQNLMQGHFGKVIVVTMALLLSACAGQPDYRAAERGGFGYSERQLTENQYRVNFKARGDDTGAAMDYAMLRASELTLENGYEWFVVTSRETFVDRERVTNNNFGFGFGYGFRSRSSYHLGMTLGDGRKEVAVNLEIRMGRGEIPESDQAYNAAELFENLQPPVE
ncbi:hypothetical protein A28LD_1449 [Idiomarina sp. A28L]|uniref:CC0125/CC1285 family lipoprotein n=1 Tax=Idiomarina sp. A28L TaxID=1036674 RepID=UPI00021389B5|nr:hypothetical protein [Idiomarina sp. A28L]EGN74987.1 hypothetical protein A28LD_1449 [Idiomarina sp. A28L]